MEIVKARLDFEPHLDIMVPTHNRIDLTINCLKAIYTNTASPFHLIVTDDSNDVLTPLFFKLLLEKGYPPLEKPNNLTYIHSDEPFREGNQFFNLALQYCKTEYMATVMNSMRVEPDWEMFAVHNIMAQNPDVGLIGLKCLFGGDFYKTGCIESAGIKMHGYMPTDMGRDFPGHRMRHISEPDAVQWAFAIVRRKAALGNLEEGVFHGFKGWDDIDNCFCLKGKGWRIIYCGMGEGYHEPRQTRGSNEPWAIEQNKENGFVFFKRWGLWDQYCRDYPQQDRVDRLPRYIEETQDIDDRVNFQQVRDEGGA